MTEELRAALLRVKFVVFDFDGVFTDNAVYVSEDGTESVRCSRGDSFGLRLLEKIGVEFMVLSTEENPVVSRRCEKIKCPCVQNVWHKGPVLAELIRARGLDPSEVAYLGNDINDLPCLEIVGVPAAVADSHPDVFGFEKIRTTAAGGHGAVRELCDLIVAAHGGVRRL